MRAVPSRTETLLARLEAVRHARPGARAAESLLAAAARLNVADADRLIRLHEAAMFLRAYPHSPRVLRLAERVLAGFEKRVAKLSRGGRGPRRLRRARGRRHRGDHRSGPTSRSTWRAGCAARAPGASADRLGRRRSRTTGCARPGPQFLPLLEEEALADANVPYLAWLGAAAGTAGGPARLAAAALREPPGHRRGPRRALRLARRADRVGPRRRTRLAHAHAPAGPAALLPRRAVSRAPGRLARRRPHVAPGPRCAGSGRREAERVCAMVREATAARYREFYHVHVRRSGVGRRDAAGAGHGALPRRRAPGPAASAARGLRRLRRQERRADRLHRGPGVLRAARDRLQHVLHVPRGRVGLDLRPGARAAPRRPRRDVVLDRPVPDRLRELRGDRLGRLLVLPQARVPADRCRRAPPARAGGAPDRRGPVVPLVAGARCAGS